MEPVFLLCQPRSGSTLLQRILGGHPEILTAGEPWILLPLLDTLRDEGWQSDWDRDTYRRALRGFLGTLPGGEDDYIEGVRRMASYLYERAGSSAAARYFLDKTPRYYHVIPELLRVFPGSRFIVLLRNPLAVLHSIVRTWATPNLFVLRGHAHDLAEAPGRLLAGIRLLGERAAVVRYEKLVLSPEDETRRLCAFLGLDYRPEMIAYGGTPLPRWEFGDAKVYDHERPEPNAADVWTASLGEPQMWRLLSDYLHLLGEERVCALGYPFADLRRALDARRPSRARLLLTLPLRSLLALPGGRGRAFERGLIRFANTLARSGLRGTATAAAWRLIGRG